MIKLALSPQLRQEMGEIGFKRVNTYYRIEQMREKFDSLYKEVYPGMEE